MTQKDDALAALVSDETLNYAWGNANFGSSNKRDVIFDTLLKVTAGYHSGHTAMTICTELDLIGGYTSGSKIFLTGKGREYFYTACKQFQALTRPPVDVEGDDGVYLTDDEWEDMVNQRECMQAEIDDLRQEIADLKAELEDR